VLFFRNYLLIFYFNPIAEFNGWIESVNDSIQFDWNVMWISWIRIKSNRWCFSPCDCISLAR